MPQMQPASPVLWLLSPGWSHNGCSHRDWRHSHRGAGDVGLRAVRVCWHRRQCWCQVGPGRHRHWSGAHRGNADGGGGQTAMGGWCWGRWGWRGCLWEQRHGLGLGTAALGTAGQRHTRALLGDGGDRRRWGHLQELLKKIARNRPVFPCSLIEKVQAPVTYLRGKT